MSAESEDDSAPVSPSSGKQGGSAEPSGEAVDVELLTQQASMTIVFHPGSSHLRIGRASDPQPVMIPHVIAWRHKRPGRQTVSRMKLLRSSGKMCEEELTKIDETIRLHGGSGRSSWKSIAKENKKKKPEKLQEGCGWTWTDTSQKPPYLIGDDALYIAEEDCYDLYWPIVDGRLNTTGKSITAVLSDLEAHWTKSIETFLGIPMKEIEKYRCVLLIPDLYVRRHVKQMVDLLLCNLNFSSVIVHQESVCATYGCGVATACVVDVGHHKTAVSCVEDGFSHFNTRMYMDIGGCDVTSTFAWLLHRSAFPYRTCKIDDRMDALLMEELKETFCHMDLSRSGPELQEFNLRRPGQLSLLYPITLGDETIQAPMSLFFPAFLNRSCNTTNIHFATANPGDSEDPHDETYLAATRTKQEEAWASKRERAAAAAVNDEKVEAMETTNDEIDDDFATSYRCNDTTAANRFPMPTDLTGVDKAIVWSIENCPDSYEDELKRRMYSCILIVGGGLANFPGVEEIVKRRVQDAIPPSSRQTMLGQVEVVTKPKDQDPSTVAWKGGSVLSCLDGAQELWIGRKQWKAHGLRKLREQCPFVW